MLSTPDSHTQQAQTLPPTQPTFLIFPGDLGQILSNYRKGRSGTCLEPPGTPTVTPILATVAAMVSGLALFTVLAAHLLSALSSGSTRRAGSSLRA